MNKKRKIGIYPRVSTKEAAKKEEGSIASQIHRLKMRVEEKNKYNDNKWGKIVAIYEEKGISAKDTNRPAFQQLLSDVRSGKIDTVMVTELSRISRSVPDFLNFIEELNKYEADFICLQYDFDTTSPAGKVFMTIIMALAQFERELTVERIKNNIYARALRGLTNGGQPILGYDKDPKNTGALVINKNENSLVKEIFNMFLEIGSISLVAKHLNERGIKNKKWINKENLEQGGQKFNHSSIHRIITNIAYIGKKAINTANKNKKQESLKPEERYQEVDSAWEAIIDEITFNRVQEKLEENKKVSHKPTHDYILSGLLYCDECGSPLFGQASTGKHRKHFYYAHKKNIGCKLNRIPVDKLEKKVKTVLFDLIKDDYHQEAFSAIIKQILAERPNTFEALTKTKKQELEELIKRKDNLLKIISMTTNEKTIENLLKEIENLDGEKEEMEAQIDKLELEEKLEQKKIDLDYVRKSIKKLKGEKFRKKSLSNKRELLRGIIKSVHINPNNVIKIDVWGGESHPVRSQYYSQAINSGQVIPLYENAKILDFNPKNNLTILKPRVRVASGMVEAAGIEPASEDVQQ